MFPWEKVDDLWAAKSEDVGLIVRTISFQDLQPMWSWSTNVTDGQTDGQTDTRPMLYAYRYMYAACVITPKAFVRGRARWLGGACGIRWRFGAGGCRRQPVHSRLDTVRSRM